MPEPLYLTTVAISGCPCCSTRAEGLGGDVLLVVVAVVATSHSMV